MERKRGETKKEKEGEKTKKKTGQNKSCQGKTKIVQVVASHGLIHPSCGNYSDNLATFLALSHSPRVKLSAPARTPLCYTWASPRQFLPAHRTGSPNAPDRL